MYQDLRVMAENIRKAETEDLLDRATVYRDDMEGAALDLIEGELSRRGIGPDEIAEHDWQRRATALQRPDGSFIQCTFCHRPAVLQAWGWNRWVGIAPPIFPQPLTYCDVHAGYAGGWPPPFGE